MTDRPTKEQLDSDLAEVAELGQLTCECRAPYEREIRLTAEVLALREENAALKAGWDLGRVDYARRARELEAEKAKLRAELAGLRAEHVCSLGVGDGFGDKFVHGRGECIQVVRDWLEALRRVEALPARRREYGSSTPESDTNTHETLHALIDELFEALKGAR